MLVQDLFSLRGQAALVTGGGAGIGKAICLMFAEAGAEVACTDLELDEAESVASECRKLGRLEIDFVDDTGDPKRLDAGGFFQPGYRGTIRVSIRDGMIQENEQDIQWWPN